MPNPLEHVASKAAGKAGAVVSRVKGLTGVFNKLAEQHKEVSTLLARIEATTEPEKRRELWSKIRIDLLSHEQGELREVYPTLEKHASLRHIVDRHNDEADELEATILQLDQLDIASDAWGVTLKRLIELVKHHVSEEENVFFPRAQEVLVKGETRDLESRYVASQESVRKQLR